MKYSEAIEFLFNQLPMYQRQGKMAFKKNLDNIRALCHAMDNPERDFPSVHIAGTNGKGSTSHMLASILTASGYKTGLYTSPHYRDYRERIRIDGNMIPEDEVIEFLEVHRNTIETVQPSFFEMSVAMAFWFFSKKNVDMAVIETGLGGRLDSTNILQPLISVITNIGYDHMDMLGDTLEKIAGEKAGIIKPDTPVIIGEKQPEVLGVFNRVAQQQGSSLYLAPDQFEAQIVKWEPACQYLDIIRSGQVYMKNVKISNGSAFQKKNIIPVMLTAELLQGMSFKHINESSIRRGLENLGKYSGFIGRWQKIGEEPLIIADSAHNVSGLTDTVRQLTSKLNYETLHIVLGMVREKDPVEVLSLFPGNAKYYYSEPDIPRAMPVDQLKAAGEQIGLQGDKYDSVEKALTAAQSVAGKNDLIFVGGSSFVAAEVI